MKYTVLRINFAAALVLALASCIGGDNDPTEPGAHLDEVLVPLQEIADRSNLLLASGAHQYISLTQEGVTTDDREAEYDTCAGTECVSEDGTIITIDELIEISNEIDVVRVDTGSHGAFNTVTMQGELNSLESEPDFSFTEPPASTLYGLWGEHGFAAVGVGSGAITGMLQGTAIAGEFSSLTAFAFGAATGTNPTGLGSATWSGIAEAASTGTFTRRQGTATVTMADLSEPSVSVDIEISGFEIGSPGWSDMQLDNGGFRFGDESDDYLEGSFHGPDHSEAYGVFDTGAYVGVFGAAREE